jgi:hypothetical protein
MDLDALSRIQSLNRAMPNLEEISERTFAVEGSKQQAT